MTTDVDKTFTPERLSTTLKTFWTPERKQLLRELAIEEGSDETPNYPAAMQRIWQVEGNKAEVKRLYNETPAFATEATETPDEGTEAE
jgi:hypothetical protein